MFADYIMTKKKDSTSCSLYLNHRLYRISIKRRGSRPAFMVKSMTVSQLYSAASPSASSVADSRSAPVS